MLSQVNVEFSMKVASLFRCSACFLETQAFNASFQCHAVSNLSLVPSPLVTRKALSGGYPLKLIMEEIDKLKSLASLAMTW